MRELEEAAAGSGRTTAQMLVAPEGAMYVWPTSDVRYAEDMARRLGVCLRVVSPAFLESSNVAGLRLPVVVDHATALTMRQVMGLERIREAIGVDRVSWSPCVSVNERAV